MNVWLEITGAETIAVRPILQLQEQRTVPTGNTFKFIAEIVSLLPPCPDFELSINLPETSSMRTHGTSPSRFAGLSRMARIDKIRKQAAAAIENDDMAQARKVGHQLDRLYQDRPDTAQGRARIAQHG